MMKFSVLMSVYAKENPKHFEIALNSIFNQTVLPDEVILMVDGPVSDDINIVIDKFTNLHNSLNVQRLEKNVGLGKALDIGLSKCSNELVARMDSDDICALNRFEKQLAFFQNNSEMSIVGSNVAEFIDDTSNIIGFRNLPEHDKDIRTFLKSRNPMNHPTVMFKKSAILNVGGYQDWYLLEDYYLWLRLSLIDCQFFNIQENLVYMRVTEDQYERRGGLKYYKSINKLEKFKLKNKIISLPKYCYNNIIRFIVQVMMTNKLRGWMYRYLLRSEKVSR